MEEYMGDGDADFFDWIDEIEVGEYKRDGGV